MWESGCEASGQSVPGTALHCAVVYFGRASQTWSPLDRKSDFPRFFCVWHFLLSKNLTLILAARTRLPMSEKWFGGVFTSCWSIFCFETSPGDHHKPRHGNQLKVRNLCWFPKKSGFLTKKLLIPRAPSFGLNFAQFFRLTTSSWSHGDRNTLYYWLESILIPLGSRALKRI